MSSYTHYLRIIKSTFAQNGCTSCATWVIGVYFGKSSFDTEVHKFIQSFSPNGSIVVPFWTWTVEEFFMPLPQCITFWVQFLYLFYKWSNSTKFTSRVFRHKATEVFWLVTTVVFSEFIFPFDNIFQTGVCISPNNKGVSCHRAYIFLASAAEIVPYIKLDFVEKSARTVNVQFLRWIQFLQIWCIDVLDSDPFPLFLLVSVQLKQL